MHALIDADISSKCENCEEGEGVELHPCPYSEELDKDSDRLCNCCNKCEYNCAMDI